MIYLYNDSAPALNSWEATYLLLQQKYCALSTAYSSAIEMTNQLHDKIKTLQKDNELLRQNKTIERLSNQQQGDSGSFQPILLGQPENVRRGPKTIHSRIKKQSSTDWDSRGSACIYECSYPECGKIYSSSVSLNLHIKTKHNGGTKKQREAYAVLIGLYRNCSLRLRKEEKRLQEWIQIFLRIFQRYTMSYQGIQNHL